MDKIPLPAIVLFVCLAAITGTAASSGTADVLVRLTGTPTRNAAVLSSPGVTLLDRGPDMMLVRVSPSALDRMHADSRPMDVLTAFDPARPLYVVQARAGADRADLLAVGVVFPLGDEAVLFQPLADRPAREVIPARLRLRALPAAGMPAIPAAVPALLVLPAPLAADPLITRLVAEVSTDHLHASIQTLQDFGTRRANNENNGCQMAGDFIFTTFTDAGVNAAFDPFTFYQYPTRNVVATLPGVTRPEEIVILCAHYDSISNAAGQAPGADDNASGTAAVLEAARLFAARSFERTVRFITFSAEEYGLYGSQHYAAAAYLTGEQIVAVLNMDMIAYVDHVPEDLDLVGNPASQWLVQDVTATAPLYVDLQYHSYNLSTWSYSDHAPFWNYGYSAFCAIEDASPANPYYHHPTDTIDKLDFDFLTRSAQAMLAVAASLAGPLPDPGDLNRDGVLDATDVLLLALYLAEETPALPPDSDPDVDGDGDVDAVDLLHLRMSTLN
jgi:hypothetical protein